MSDPILENSLYLDELLTLAARDPAERPRFMEKLLEAEVFVVPHPSGEFPVIEAGKTVGATQVYLATYEHHGKRYIPFFTTPAKLPSGSPYLMMKSRLLFELTKGSLLVLNPGSATGKEFVPEEIERLLNGAYFQPPAPHVLAPMAKVRIARAENSIEIESILKRLYGKSHRVKAAFIVSFHDPARDPVPGLLVVLDVDSEPALRRTVTETVNALGSGTLPQPQVDICKLEPDEIADFIKSEKIEPFYKRGTIATWINRIVG